VNIISHLANLLVQLHTFSLSAQKMLIIIIISFF